MKAPALFLAHGSPMLAIEDSSYASFLTTLGKQMHPKAIVVFTAHWMTRQPTVSSIDGTYEIIYDFSGFPHQQPND